MAARKEVLPQGPVPGGALLILCSLGTHPQPFERALDWVLVATAGEELVVQHGATPARRELESVRWHRFLGYDELVATMEAADAVVCHAGVGTLMTAIQLGVIPVALPRLSSEGEHVDDHQVQIATELGESGYVLPCMRQDALAQLLEQARHTRQPFRRASAELRGAAIAAAGGDPDRGIV